MNQEQIVEVQVPKILGICTDSPRPGGLIEGWNVYSVDGGNALQTKQLGRYCETPENVIDDQASDNGLSLFQFDISDGNKKVIIDSGDKLYIADNDTSVVGEISIGEWVSVTGFQSIGGTTMRPNYSVFQDVCFRADGVNANIKIDDQGAATPIGIAPPTYNVASNNGSTGQILAGDYDVYYCYIRTVGAYELKSNPSPLSAVTVIGYPSGGRINVAVRASPDASVTAIRVYRTLFSAGGIYYQANSTDYANANATVTLNDSDEDIRMRETMSFDYVQPPVCDFVLAAQNRLWLFDSTNCRAYYSEENKPEEFQADNYTSDFDAKDGDILTGVALLKNQIIVFKRNKTFAIDLSGRFPVIKIDATDGCINYRTIAVDNANNVVMYLSTTGVWMRSIGQKIDMTDGKLWRTDMFNNLLNLSLPQYCFGSYSRVSGCYHLYFNVDGDPINSCHYVCSLKYSGVQGGAWFKYDHLYSLDGDDPGLKFYSFGILTDNAGLPSLCAMSNDSDNTNPGRVFQIDGNGDTTLPAVYSNTEIDIYNMTLPLDEDPFTMIVYFYLLRTANGWMNFGQGDNRYPGIQTINASGSTSVYLGNEVDLGIDTGSGEFVNGILGWWSDSTYYYTLLEIMNSIGETREIKARINRSSYAQSFYTTLPGGATEIPKVISSIDEDYIDLFGSRTGPIITGQDPNTGNDIIKYYLTIDINGIDRTGEISRYSEEEVLAPWSYTGYDVFFGSLSARPRTFIYAVYESMP